MNGAKGAALDNPVALASSNYPYQSWWVAAFSTEVSSNPIDRWILEMPVLLYRRADGQAVALDNRCPHRWAPLSAGHVEGDNIVCPYHGFQFGPDGNCKKIPTQDTIPGVARVRSYTLLEKPPFIWIWTGDPDGIAEAEEPPELPWAIDSTRVTARGYLPVECNYMALKENVLDLSHFAFVHANTLGIKDWTNPPQIHKTDLTVGYSQIFESNPLPAIYGIPTSIGLEKNVRRHGWGTFVSPAIHLSGIDITDPDPGLGRRSDFTIRICHATTPSGLGECHYWWFFSQDYGQGPNADEILKGLIEKAFLEDKAVLEASERLVRRDPRGHDYPEIAIACDRAGIEARRILAKRLG